MREKKGGALQKLKKRLSHSFGRLSKKKLIAYFFVCAHYFSHLFVFVTFYFITSNTRVRAHAVAQWLKVQSHFRAQKLPQILMAYCNFIHIFSFPLCFTFTFIPRDQRYHERTPKIRTIICSITIIISIAVVMATIRATKFHSMATTPKNIWIDSNQMEIFQQINPI